MNSDFHYLNETKEKNPVLLTANQLKHFIGCEMIFEKSGRIAKLNGVMLEPFMIHDIKVSPFMLSHDAAEPVGYVIENEMKKMVILK